MIDVGLLSLVQVRTVSCSTVSGQIRECLEAAENCARKAATLPDSSPFKQDFLNLEQRWLELARSIEFGESLDRFTKITPSRTSSRRPIKIVSVRRFPPP